MLVISPEAQRVIGEIVEDAGLHPDGGLRISSVNGGGGEAALEFELADAPLEGDEVVHEGRARVFLDELAAELLADQVLEVEAHGDHFHFSLGEQEG